MADTASSQAQTTEHLAILRDLAERYVKLAQREFGRDLVSAALFGSVARGTARPDSDVDLLLIVRGLPRKAFPRYDLLKPIDRELGDRCYELWKAGKVETEFTVILHTPEQAEHHPPLYLDLIEDAHILHDPQGFLARVLQDIRDRLSELGGYRVWLDGDEWYWVLKKDYVPGELIEV